MQSVETELADLRRRIGKLSRDELMMLIEGVVADWRAERVRSDQQLREELQMLLAHEAKQRLAQNERATPERAP